MNREAERLTATLAAEALNDYEMSREAWRQELESLTQVITDAVEAHLESLGLARRTGAGR